jgi:hypothetical protein
MILSISIAGNLACWKREQSHPVLEMSHKTTGYEATDEYDISSIDVIRHNA